MTALDANRRLAELLGWTEIVNVGGAWLGRPPGGSQKSRDQARVPDWAGDWRDCGPLQAQHVRRLRLWPHRALVGVTPGGPAEHDVVRDRAEGEDLDTALRHGIVAAVIAHLEAGR
jgi:hypothetical protein